VGCLRIGERPIEFREAEHLRTGIAAPHGQVEFANADTPVVHDGALDAAHGFFFGHASVGDAIEVEAEKIDFIL
jgi:hypothetical protein